MAKAQRCSLADQLRQAIRDSGITIYKLSQESGVHRSQLSRFLHGERDLSLAVSDKICGVLGVQFCKTVNGLVLLPAKAPRTRKDT
jgi:transcriptional regulator with XRE-family HTH domain